MTRAIAFLVAILVSLAAYALTGQIVGTTGTSQGTRFGVTGAALPVNQAPAAGAQYSVAAVVAAPVAQTNAIFNNGFE